MTFSREAYLKCCGSDRAYFVFGERGYEKVASRLKYEAEKTVDGGFYLMRGACQACGMVWRNERECRGRMDWDNRLFQEPWAVIDVGFGGPL